MPLLDDDKKSAMQATLLTFTKNVVRQLLAEHPDAVFYAMAYDTYAAYGQVGISFNTLDALQQTRDDYRREYPQMYADPSSLDELTYSIGDWRYFMVGDAIYPITDEEISELTAHLELSNDDDYEQMQALLADIRAVFYDTLVAFMQTPEYHAIPKTDDFAVLISDYDDEPRFVVGG